MSQPSQPPHCRATQRPSCSLPSQTLTTTSSASQKTRYTAGLNPLQGNPAHLFLYCPAHLVVYCYTHLFVRCPTCRSCVCGTYRIRAAFRCYSALASWGHRSLTPTASIATILCCYWQQTSWVCWSQAVVGSSLVAVTSAVTPSPCVPHCTTPTSIRLGGRG